MKIYKDKYFYSESDTFEWVVYLYSDNDVDRALMDNISEWSELPDYGDKIAIKRLPDRPDMVIVFKLESDYLEFVFKWL